MRPHTSRYREWQCYAPSYASLYLEGWGVGEGPFLLRGLIDVPVSCCLMAQVHRWHSLYLGCPPPSNYLRNSYKFYISIIIIWNYNLKFIMQYNLHNIPFLDILICKDECGLLSTNLFRKSTAGNTLLDASSSHLSSLVQSIPYSQYLRLRCNCSTEEDFWRESSLLQPRLLQRGYSIKLF